MTDDIRCSILVQAAPEAVARYFTDADLMLRWMGEKAELNPQPGGRLAIDIRGTAVRGEYLEIGPDRVVFTWGFAGSAELPPRSSTVEVTFTAVGSGTRVDLTHSGLPPVQVENHRSGWNHFLAALASLL